MTSKFIFMSSFEHSIKPLKKRYRNVTLDVEEAIQSIEANPQIGTVIPNDFQVRKLRVASRDMQRGKSGGFRLLYLLSEEVTPIVIYLLLVYAKTDQEDITLTELQGLVSDLPMDENDTDEDD